MTKQTKHTTDSGLHALVWQEDDLYVAKTIELELASQGQNKQDALSNLEEAIALFLQDEKISTKKLPFFSNLSLESVTPQAYA
mgnify:FL=1